MVASRAAGTEANPRPEGPDESDGGEGSGAPAQMQWPVDGILASDQLVRVDMDMVHQYFDVTA